MALIGANELKKKMLIEIEGQPYNVLDVFFATPTARGASTMVRTRLKNLLNGAVQDDRYFLKEGIVLEIFKYNGQAVSLQLPQYVELEISSTEPGLRGDTAAGGATKVATLETGLEVRVPLFMKDGEMVRVNTQTHEVAGRA
jgi:elongation factor P